MEEAGAHLELESDRLRRLKLEIEGVMLSDVSAWAACNLDVS